MALTATMFLIPVSVSFDGNAWNVSYDHFGSYFQKFWKLGMIWKKDYQFLPLFNELLIKSWKHCRPSTISIRFIHPPLSNVVVSLVDTFLSKLFLQGRVKILTYVSQTWLEEPLLTTLETSLHSLFIILKKRNVGRKKNLTKKKKLFKLMSKCSRLF